MSTSKEPVSKQSSATIGRCFIRNIDDVSVLMQAAIEGSIPSVMRRLTSEEKHRDIKSGNVFIFHEETAGFKRWTDSMQWSPSRVRHNFMLYYRKGRETFATINERQASDLDKKSLGNSRCEPQPLKNRDWPFCNKFASNIYKNGPKIGSREDRFNCNREIDPRDVYGSWLSLKERKPQGLMKKTITIDFNGSRYRVVGYYNPREALSGSLLCPTYDARFSGTRVTINFEIPGSQEPKTRNPTFDNIQIRFRSDFEDATSRSSSLKHPQNKILPFVRSNQEGSRSKDSKKVDGFYEVMDPFPRNLPYRSSNANLFSQSNWGQNFLDSSTSHSWQPCANNAYGTILSQDHMPQNRSLRFASPGNIERFDATTHSLSQMHFYNPN